MPPADPRSLRLRRRASALLNDSTLDIGKDDAFLGLAAAHRGHEVGALDRLPFRAAVRARVFVLTPS